MYDKSLPAQFDVSCPLKGIHDARLMQGEQAFQFEVRDVASRNMQEAGGTPQHQIRIDEIPVLADQHAFVAVADVAQAIVQRAVASGKIERVDRVVSALPQQIDEPARKLGVDEKSHETPTSMLLTRLNRAANANTASMSSRSRSR